MKRNSLGQFAKQDKEEDQAITIPLPRLTTIIVLILLIVLLVPWLRMLMNLEILNKIDKFFDFTSNNTCRIPENMDVKGASKNGGWGL